jgi:hypothetical protein
MDGRMKFRETKKTYEIGTLVQNLPWRKKTGIFWPIS